MTMGKKKAKSRIFRGCAASVTAGVTGVMPVLGTVFDTDGVGQQRTSAGDAVSTLSTDDHHDDLFSFYFSLLSSYFNAWSQRSMMRPTNDSQHDEINLFRLVRRLEKAVQVKDGWEADGEGGYDEIRIKARKELQKVKYARKLVRNVEGYEQGSR
jgi:hypothetical protein